MARGIIDGAVTARNLIAACGAAFAGGPSSIAEEPQTVKRDTAEKQKSKPLRGGEKLLPP